MSVRRTAARHLLDDGRRRFGARLLSVTLGAAGAAILAGLGVGVLVADPGQTANGRSAVASSSGGVAAAGARQPASGVPGVPSPWQARDTSATAIPIRVSAPAIDLSADLVALGTAADGTIEVPSATEDAGWLTGSAVPGATGPAVIAGHVDSTNGPAVFFRLGDLGAGDAVEVELSDGTTARFVVTSTVRAAKEQFPTDLVYGPVPDPQLRLITCGGEFDRTRRSYQDNVVVFARLA